MRAARAATSSARVDLPTPGSPARRTTEPGTIPPPSTRSSSPTPVGRARDASAGTRAMGSAVVAGVTTARAGRAVSATVPQAWHSPHLPTHLGVVQPQSAQEYWVRVLVMVRVSRPALTRTIPPERFRPENDFHRMWP